MGLDITAYRQLTEIENPELDSYGDLVHCETQWKAYSVSYTEETWPGRTEGLEENAVYSFDDCMNFRAGGYGGYNNWRDTLATIAGYDGAQEVWDKPPPESGPFVELINFSDCDGVIGPVVAAKLAKDFAAFRDKAEAHGDAYFFELYCQWQEAFEMAAVNGAVSFH